MEWKKRFDKVNLRSVGCYSLQSGNLVIKTVALPKVTDKKPDTKSWVTMTFPVVLPRLVDHTNCTDRYKEENKLVVISNYDVEYGHEEACAVPPITTFSFFKSVSS